MPSLEKKGRVIPFLRYEGRAITHGEVVGKRRNTMFSANCVMLIDGIKGFRYMLVLFEQVTFHWFVKG